MENVDKDDQSIGTPLKNEDASSSQGQTFQPSVITNSEQTPHKKSRKKLFVLILLLLAVAGAAAWYFLLRNDDAQLNQQSPTTQNQNQAQDLSISKLVYAKNSGDDTVYNIYNKSLSAADKGTVRLEGRKYISNYAVYKNKVALVMEQSNQENKGLEIWYSEDSGNTYTKIFEREAVDSESGLGDQVASMIFSTDGTSLVVGLLASSDEVNKVIEITKAKINELFTSEDRGVFLESYNREKEQIIYWEGCYNCDGNTFDKILKRDLSNQSVETLLSVEDSKFAIESMAPSNDGSKFLIGYGTIDTNSKLDGIGVATKAPYKVELLNVETGKAESLVTTNDQIFSVGFTDDTDEPYMVTDNKVIRLSGRKQSTIFEYEGGSISDTYYVSSEDLVFRTVGKDSLQKIYVYKNADKSLEKIEEGDFSNLSIFGVAKK